MSIKVRIKKLESVSAGQAIVRSIDESGVFVCWMPRSPRAGDTIEKCTLWGAGA